MQRLKSRRILLLAGVALLATAATAGPDARPGAYFETPRAFYPDADHDPALPTLAETVGFAPGEWFVSPSQARAYLAALAGASDRVRLEEYGRTVEGRPLLLAIISAPRNLERLDAIRANLQRMRNPGNGIGPEERATLLGETPLVVWLGYGIHGDEHSSTEAALMTAHHLAADRTEETRRWLEAAVILIDPMQNPDGRVRFLRWQEATVARDRAGRPRPDPNPAAAEHNQPWPGGRFNHYLFDLNRDWFFLTQAETRARVAAFQEWSPQVFVDLHEMETNATYFFPPFALPINPFPGDGIRPQDQIERFQFTISNVF